MIMWLTDKRYHQKLLLFPLPLFIIILLAIAVSAIATHAQSGREIDTVRLSSPNPGQIRVSWDAPGESPVDYRMSWTKVGEKFKTWSDSSGNAYPSNPEYTINGLDDGQRYKIRVRARYNGSAGPFSSVSEISVAQRPTNPPPPPPTNTLQPPPPTNTQPPPPPTNTQPPPPPTNTQPPPSTNTQPPPPPTNTLPPPPTNTQPPPQPTNTQPPPPPTNTQPPPPTREPVPTEQPRNVQTRPVEGNDAKYGLLGDLLAPAEPWGIVPRQSPPVIQATVDCDTITASNAGDLLADLTVSDGGTDYPNKMKITSTNLSGCEDGFHYSLPSQGVAYFLVERELTSEFAHDVACDMSWFGRGHSNNVTKSIRARPYRYGNQDNPSTSYMIDGAWSTFSTITCEAGDANLAEYSQSDWGYAFPWTLQTPTALWNNTATPAPTPTAGS